MAGPLMRLQSSKAPPVKTSRDSQADFRPGHTAGLAPGPCSTAWALFASALTYLGHTLISRVACQRSRPFSDLQCPFVLNVLFTLHSQQIWGRNSMNQNPFLTPPGPWSLRAKVPK